jgi:hypothetical protein
MAMRAAQFACLTSMQIPGRMKATRRRDKQSGANKEEMFDNIHQSDQEIHISSLISFIGHLRSICEKLNRHLNLMAMKRHEDSHGHADFDIHESRLLCPRLAEDDILAPVVSRISSMTVHSLQKNDAHFLVHLV